MVGSRVGDDGRPVEGHVGEMLWPDVTSSTRLLVHHVCVMATVFFVAGQCSLNRHCCDLVGRRLRSSVTDKRSRLMAYLYIACMILVATFKYFFVFSGC